MLIVNTISTALLAGLITLGVIVFFNIPIRETNIRNVLLRYKTVTFFLLFLGLFTIPFWFAWARNGRFPSLADLGAYVGLFAMAIGLALSFVFPFSLTVKIRTDPSFLKRKGKQTYQKTQTLLSKLKYPHSIIVNAPWQLSAFRKSMAERNLTKSDKKEWIRVLEQLDESRCIFNLDIGKRSSTATKLSLDPFQIITTRSGELSPHMQAITHTLTNIHWLSKPFQKAYWNFVSQKISRQGSVFVVSCHHISGLGCSAQDIKSVREPQNLLKQLEKQTTLSLGYLGRDGQNVLLDQTLYLPKALLQQPVYETYRNNHNITDVDFKEKSTLILEMIENLQNSNIDHLSPWIVIDNELSQEVELLHKISKHGFSFFTEVSDNLWVQIKNQAEQPTPVTLKQLTNEILPEQWLSAVIVHNHTRSHTLSNYVAMFVDLLETASTLQNMWLIIQQENHAKTYRYFLSNAPANTSEETLIELSQAPMLPDISLTQSQPNDSFVSYDWSGWYQQATLSTLAYFFLVRLERRLGNTPQLTLEQAQLLLSAVIAQSISEFLEKGQDKKRYISNHEKQGYAPPFLP